MNITASTLLENYLTDIDKYFKDTLKQVYNGKNPTNKMLIAMGKLLSEQVQQSYGEVAVDFSTPDAEMLVQLSRNVWQFSAAKNYQQLQDLKTALRDENGKLREWKDFQAKAEKIGIKYNETWMRTEYDQAISGAQSAARWTEYEQNAEIMPNLQYQTVGDAHVREEHRILDGIVRPINDVFWNTHYPPNGWGCRCEAIQVPTGLAPVTPAENIPQSPVAPMFRTNLAKTGLIFPKGHPYYKGIPQAELTRAIAHLPPENTYITFATEPQIEINVLHGKNEIEGNLRVTNAFIDNVDNPENPITKVQLLPELKEKDKHLKSKFYPKNYVPRNENKNADAVFSFDNGEKWVVDFKYMTGGGEKLKDRIKQAYQQADYAIIMFENDITISKRTVVKNVSNSMNRYPDLKGVYVFDKNENLIWGANRND